MRWKKRWDENSKGQQRKDFPPLGEITCEEGTCTNFSVLNYKNVRL